jgi:hypothetical protein
MLSAFWTAARELDPDVVGERARPGVTQGDLGERFRRAGLLDVVEGALEVGADYADFDDFWQPFTFAVGPAGQHVASLPPDRQQQLREACRAAVPASAPFSLSARAWYAQGTAP